MITRSSYTLVELLAVVVILGLVASMGTSSLVRAVRSNPISDGIKRLRALDAWTRRDVPSDGAVERLRPDGAEIVFADGRPGDRAEVPPDVSVRWSALSHQTIDAIHYDARGRSEDLLVDITTGETRRSFLISGVSGEWDEVHP